MYTLFVIIIVIASLLMIGIVLIQESKGGGLASNFSSSNQIMGVRKTTDFIEKTTWGLAIVMVVCSIVCAHVAPTADTDTSVVEKTAGSSTANPNTMPNFGASQQQKQGAAQQKQGTQQGAQQQGTAQQQGAAPAAPAQGGQQNNAQAPAK